MISEQLSLLVQGVFTFVVTCASSNNDVTVEGAKQRVVINVDSEHDYCSSVELVNDYRYSIVTILFTNID